MGSPAASVNQAAPLRNRRPPIASALVITSPTVSLALMRSAGSAGSRSTVHRPVAPLIPSRASRTASKRSTTANVIVTQKKMWMPTVHAPPMPAIRAPTKPSPSDSATAACTMPTIGMTMLSSITSSWRYSTNRSGPMR